MKHLKIKKEAASRLKYSEKRMADAFMRLLQSYEGLPGIGNFDGVYREVTCCPGRPDFIALRCKSSQRVVPLPKATGFAGASILSLLKPRSPRTMQYLIENSEFSAGTIKRSLRQLVGSGHINITDTGSYIMGAASGQFDIEIWTFELKLDNPKRAVFQAQQSRAFAARSIIVVPPNQARNYERYFDTIKRWSIGLATFDYLSRSFLLKISPRKSHAFSRQHQIYAIAQLHAIRNPSLCCEARKPKRVISR